MYRICLMSLSKEQDQFINQEKGKERIMMSLWMTQDFVILKCLMLDPPRLIRLEMAQSSLRDMTQCLIMTKDFPQQFEVFL